MYGVPTHTMLRAALKQVRASSVLPKFWVPTHVMPRAALKHRVTPVSMTEEFVPTHIMPRAALKPLLEPVAVVLAGPDTHNAACGIETGLLLYRQSSFSMSRHT